MPPYDGNPGNDLAQLRSRCKQYLLSQMNTGDLQKKVAGRPADPMLANIKLTVPNPTGPDNTPQIGDAVTVSIQAPDYAIAIARRELHG